MKRITVGAFLLQSPGAQILDLGTEFGVVVDQRRNTDVCVFDGTIQVSETGDQSREGGAAVLLTEGMAARVDAGGISSIDASIQTRFTRELSSPVGDKEQISLVEVFSGQKSGEYSLGQTIASDTGMQIQKSLLIRNDNRILDQPKSKDLYVAMDWHPMVDGIFIPNPRGTNVQVDSADHRIELPQNEGKTTSPIWSRKKTDTPDFMFNETFWGHSTNISIFKHLETSKFGMIGVHANVGVTFDLDAIRDRYQQELSAFKSEVVNLDNKQDFQPERTDRSIADIRVFVDGELRDSHLEFGKSDGALKLAASLLPSDRFLTIVTTDCGTISYDQVVLIDPVILIK